MRRRFSRSICWLAVGLVALQVDAAVVLLKSSAKPVMGYLVHQDERTIVIREELAGGKTRETPFSRDQIDELIITVLPERLAELDQQRPESYLEYAEELAEKRRDPEARDGAIRLFAIAAARGEGKLRHSALLGLIALARSPQEDRRFRAAAFLHDPAHDLSLVETSAAPKNAEVKSWSQQARIGGLAPLPLLDLETLTEFDPRQCVYLNGKWIKP